MRAISILIKCHHIADSLSNESTPVFHSRVNTYCSLMEFKNETTNYEMKPVYFEISFITFIAAASIK